MGAVRVLAPQAAPLYPVLHLCISSGGPQAGAVSAAVGVLVLHRTAGRFQALPGKGCGQHLGQPGLEDHLAGPVVEAVPVGVFPQADGSCG